jgi:hypothetical protein
MAVDFDALTSAAILKAFAVEGRVLIQRGGEKLIEIGGIFDRFQIEAMGEDGAPFSIKKTVLGIRQADLPPGVELRAGDRAQILGRAFHITDVQPDGLGWLVLPLGFLASAGP